MPADETSRRVGAPAKAEHVNFVTVFVIFGEKLVTLDDVDLQTRADGATDELIVPLGADAFVTWYTGEMALLISSRFAGSVIRSYAPSLNSWKSNGALKFFRVPSPMALSPSLP